MSGAHPDRAAEADERGFMSLLDVHDELHDTFFRHQECLLARDVARSREALDEFESLLVAHMRFEEVRLLPIFERAGPIPGGGSDLFRNEHAKLLRYVAGIRTALESLCPDDPGGSRRVIELLDFEARFKSLLTHHDLRERNILYPTLNAVATAGEARDLLAAPADGGARV